MSQHNILHNTRKKITHLVVALALASAPLAMPSLASADDMTSGDDSGYQDTTAMQEEETPGDNGDQQGDPSDMQQENQLDDQSSRDENSGNTNGETASTDDSWNDTASDDGSDQGTHEQWQDNKSDGNTWHNSDDEDCPDGSSYTNKDGDYNKRDQGNYNHNKGYKDHQTKEQQQQPVHKVVVTTKPAEVRQEVNQNQQVKQETNVTVQREAVVQKERPVVHRQVVQKVVPVTTTTTKTTPTTPATPVPVEQGGKGALQETGSATTTNTAAGLGILGALGALHMLTRRKKSAAHTQE